MTLRVITLGFAVAFALPHTAVACAQLSENIWMCDRGTAWEAADWDAAGDGSARFLDDLTLTFTEEWPGFEIGDDLTTLEERYATYAEWMVGDGQIPLEELQFDRVTVGGTTSVRSIQRDEIEGNAFMSVVMLAEVGASRIMLFLDAPDNTPSGDMDTMSRDILALLNDNCADEISCADDYERPFAANERG